MAAHRRVPGRRAAGDSRARRAADRRGDRWPRDRCPSALHGDGAVRALRGLPDRFRRTSGCPSETTEFRTENSRGGGPTMTSPTPERGEASTRAEIPDKHVPAVEYTDLPEPLPMKKVLGPSVLLLAGAIGSGEYVLWPSIASQVGLVLVWLVILGVGTQYFLNMEIERYTLATGETAVTGFTRLWKPWGILFIVMGVLAWMWPGWATGGTTTLSFALGLLRGLDPLHHHRRPRADRPGAHLLAGRLPDDREDPVLHGRADRALHHLRGLRPARRRRVRSAWSRLRRGGQDPGRCPRRGCRRPAGCHRLRRRRRRDEPRAVQLGPRQGPGHGREAAEGGLTVHRRGGRRADDRLLLPPRRGEHAPLERLVEGRQPRAVLDVLRDRRVRPADLHDADVRHGRRRRHRRRELRLHQPAGRGAQGRAGRVARHGVLADRQRGAVLDQPDRAST